MQDRRLVPGGRRDRPAGERLGGRRVGDHGRGTGGEALDPGGDRVDVPGREPGAPGEAVVARPQVVVGVADDLQRVVPVAAALQRLPEDRQAFPGRGGAVVLGEDGEQRPADAGEVRDGVVAGVAEQAGRHEHPAEPRTDRVDQPLGDAGVREVGAVAPQLRAIRTQGAGPPP
ncbi:hypothetical protein GCM10020001_077820 [Nonomuraea salmonea]